MWQAYISTVEDDSQKDSTAIQRQNLEICLEFIKQHGYPAGRYNFFTHNGILEILMDKEVF